MSEASVNAKIGHPFRDAALLQQALTHRSYSATHNERLEFLGDSVLNCVISDLLYRRFPQFAEGDLSRLRASLVNQQALSSVAESLGLGAELMMGEGELKSGGYRRPSILANAVEAIIAAVFLDGGFVAAREVIERLFATQLGAADPRTLGKDPKTLLQESLQARRMALPQYVVVATQGDAHDQIFRVECVINELNIRTTGEGPSRRSAEQAAARLAHGLISRN
jgi:ribonuclease III